MTEMGYLEVTHGVLDDGFVRYNYHAGNDLAVVNHARISLAHIKEALELPDEKLIHYLMRNRHGTPFESIFISFHIRAPIFVARQWMRHRIASYNEISGRYVKMENKFYVPKGPYIREQVGKRGDYHFQEIADKDRAETIEYIIRNILDNCAGAYERLLELGLAKEVARIVLPTALYTEFYFDVNTRSLMNFISQRNHPHAQLEMRLYAEIIEQMFACIAPICYNAFIENGRVAP